MLSRVAENLYWSARNLERAENTARLVNVNAHLLLDLPKGIAPGWEPLIAITGGEALYHELYPEPDERSVVKFLVADRRNTGSILSSLAAARENTRTIRDVVPREVWEAINELHLDAKADEQAGLSKRGRHTYLTGVIRGAQSISGMVMGTMNHNAGYEFMRIGRLLERADMTTRIVDVRSANLLPDETSGLRPFENIQWMSVLKSLTAYQMYRQKMQVRVRRVDSLRFLLQDDEFPRSLYRCIVQLGRGLARLPRNEGPRRALGRLQRTVPGADMAALSQVGLHEFIDQLQVGLAALHDEISRTYFLVQSRAEQRQAS